MIELFVALIGPLLKVYPAPPSVPQGARASEIFRASPRWLAYRYLTVALGLAPAFIGWVVVLLATLAVIPNEKPIATGAGRAIVGIYFLLMLVSAVFSLAAVRLEYEYRCYVITDRSLRIRQGIWEQVEATLTYANVQNVRVLQGPLERLFGVASVVVDTAGGAGKSQAQDPMLKHHRGVLRGIENAEGLRARIMEKLKESRSSGLGDPDEKHARLAPSGEDRLALLASIRDEARALAKAARG